MESRREVTNVYGGLYARLFDCTNMRRILITLWLVLFAPLVFAIPTAPSVTFGTTADPNTFNATQFNKYDGSVFVKTSDGTANGVVYSVWHYSVKNNKWVKVPAASWGAIGGSIASQTDLQSALNGKQATLSLTTTGNGTATLIGATLNVPTPSIPAQFNPTAGAGISITGSYPNLTISNTLPAMIRKPLTANVSSTVNTRANITDWSFLVTAGKSYRIEVIATYQSAALTTGGSLGFVLPTGAGTVFGFVEGDIVNTAATTTLRQPVYAINATSTTAGSFITTTGVGVINSPHSIHSVIAFNCTTTGKFQVQWATEVAASAAQLNAGSTLYVTEF